jgi:3-isopropylmalate dehydratase small subunit
MIPPYLFAGKAWKFGDNVSTDEILPVRYMQQIEPAQLASHAMEGADPFFAKEVKEGDIVVAGENFGYGSSREQAPLALKYSGVRIIIAKSFARIFYRNAINIGLIPLIAPDAVNKIKPGDLLQINLSEGTITIKNRTEQSSNFQPIPEFLLRFINQGGLMPSLIEFLASE